MYIQCEIPVTTSLSNLWVTNEDDYLDYLQNQIFAEETPKLVTVFRSEEYGDTAITFFIKKRHFLEYSNKGVIGVIFASGEINCEDQYPIDYKLLDHLENDSKFNTFIEDNAAKFIEQFNAFVNNVKHPNDVDIIYENGRILIEISPYTTIENPEWVSFSLDTSVYSGDIDIYSINAAEFHHMH